MVQSAPDWRNPAGRRAVDATHQCVSVAGSDPIGRHKITLINTTYSIRESFPVEIKRGQAEKLVKDYSDRPEVKKVDASLFSPK